MFKRTLLPALLFSTISFGITPPVSAGPFRHSAVEHHEKLERNRIYYERSYAYGNRHDFRNSGHDDSNGYGRIYNRPQGYFERDRGRGYHNGAGYEGHGTGRDYRH